MSNQSGIGARFYWLIVVLGFAAATTLLFYRPVEETIGPIQKIFYLHLPSGICAFLACTVAFVGGVGYLWHRRMAWDDLSAAAAKVAALMCTVVLVTGMIWGRAAWGTWWTWRSPRLTFSLLLWLLYVVYLIIRPSIEPRSRRALICSVYVVAAFLDVPLVYLSARLVPDMVHPPSVSLAPSMKITLGAWFVPVVLLTAGLIIAWSRKNRRQRQRQLETSRESTWRAPDPKARDTQ